MLLPMLLEDASNSMYASTGTGAMNVNDNAPLTKRPSNINNSNGIINQREDDHTNNYSHDHSHSHSHSHSAQSNTSEGVSNNNSNYNDMSSMNMNTNTTACAAYTSQHKHRLEGKCGHRAIIHKPSDGNAHIDFVVDGQIECYEHCKPRMDDTTAFWLSKRCDQKVLKNNIFLVSTMFVCFVSFCLSVKYS